MLTILRVKGASSQDIDDLGEGTLHSLCLDWLLVDLHFPRGDSGRCHELGGYNHMRSHVILLRPAHGVRAKLIPDDRSEADSYPRRSARFLRHADCPSDQRSAADRLTAS